MTWWLEVTSLVLDPQLPSTFVYLDNVGDHYADVVFGNVQEILPDGNVKKWSVLDFNLFVIFDRFQFRMKGKILPQLRSN